MEEKFYSVQQAAELLHYDERRIRALLHDRKLVGAYQLTPKGKWLIPEGVLFRLNASQQRSDPDAEVPEERVEALVKKLEEGFIRVAGKRVSMARLLWMLGEFLLAGMEPVSIFPTALAALSEGSDEERATAANYAARELMFKLRAFQLVRDENRNLGVRAYNIVTCTPLGARVLQALMSRGWPRQ